MKWLSKAGSIIAKALQIVGVFSPAIVQTVPGSSAIVSTVSQDLAQIADVIVQIEAAGQALQLAGPQKLTAAAPLVAQIILKSTLLAQHKIAQPELFNQGVEKIASGMADVLNSLHADGVVTVDKA